ncbi:hypothetical protein MTR67_036720 [Solanum verrucosum]|uniref:Dolichyl-diphosphooligosaccharide--protein glycosyltransferase subunit DAD1 n=1 Tax=Solanum verrucosum TaxID=315347 RepID=A0AAF0UCM2_SOLVR|nr:hypothetical protein MTR67_036720 [Solanum verrucosum]
MAKSSATKDAQALFHSLRSAYAATPTNLKIIDLYVIFAISTALIQVVYMAIVGSFPFNSFLSGVLSCIGTAVLAVCLRIQVNKENKEFKKRNVKRVKLEAAGLMFVFPFKLLVLTEYVNESHHLIVGSPLQDLPPERAFADFVLCNLVLHLVIMNFLG